MIMQNERGQNTHIKGERVKIRLRTNNVTTLLKLALTSLVLFTLTPVSFSLTILFNIGGTTMQNDMTVKSGS